MRLLIVSALLAACSSNRISAQSDEDIALLCNEHPVSGNYYCPGPMPRLCYRAVANGCPEELVKASDECSATVDDFIACAEATPCPLTGIPECAQLAACGIEVRHLNAEGCP